MTAPAPPTATTDQILLKLGEMAATLAVMDERLKAVPDHESRLRGVEGQLPPRLEDRLSSLETSRAKILGLSALTSLISGGAGTVLGLIIAHR